MDTTVTKEDGITVVESTSDADQARAKSQSTPVQPSAGMTVVEQVYSAAVLVCCFFILMLLAIFHFLIIPGTEDPDVFYYLVTIWWTILAVLAITTLVNLARGSLLIVPTILQCVSMGLTIYMLPIAIWGGVLLKRRLERTKMSARSDDVQAS